MKGKLQETPPVARKELWRVRKNTTGRSKENEFRFSRKGFKRYSAKRQRKKIAGAPSMQTCFFFLGRRRTFAQRKEGGGNEGGSTYPFGRKRKILREISKCVKTSTTKDGGNGAKGERGQKGSPTGFNKRRGEQRA